MFKRSQAFSSDLIKKQYELDYFQKKKDSNSIYFEQYEAKKVAPHFTKFDG
jgi:hypothetical protein